MDENKELVDALNNVAAALKEAANLRPILTGIQNALKDLNNTANQKLR